MIPQSLRTSAALLAIALCSSCTSGRLLRLPFDASGQNPASLNSAYAELDPHATGRYVAFISDRNGSEDVYLYDLQDRRAIPLPGLNALDVVADDPSVSQDGRWIVFAGSRQGKTDIFLYRRDTQQLRNLTENLAADVRNPTLSADGTRIAFEANRNGQWDILLRDRQGKAIDVP